MERVHSYERESLSFGIKGSLNIYGENPIDIPKEMDLDKKDTYGPITSKTTIVVPNVPRFPFPNRHGPMSIFRVTSLSFL